MAANVGLSTPRGSGTSGYVQSNKAHLRTQNNRSEPYPKDFDTLKHKQRQPDKDILEHDRKREIEVKVFELRDQLEDEEVDPDEIDDRCDALRAKLTAEQARSGGGGPNTRNLKSHQVHELAKAKIDESEKLRKALGISKDYEEGSHWRRQEERKMEAERERGRGKEGD